MRAESSFMNPSESGTHGDLPQETAMLSAQTQQ
jgi:hypothetical protein